MLYPKLPEVAWIRFPAIIEIECFSGLAASITRMIAIVVAVPMSRVVPFWHAHQSKIFERIHLALASGVTIGPDVKGEMYAKRL